MLDHHCRGRAEHFTVAESRYWFRVVVVGNAGFFFSIYYVFQRIVRMLCGYVKIQLQSLLLSYSQ